MSHKKRNSISSKQDEDQEFRNPSFTVSIPPRSLIKPSATQDFARKDTTSVQNSVRLSQMYQIKNQKSMIFSLKKIQNAENSSQNNKGSIYSRYSRNRESVNNLFALIRPEPARSTVFRPKTEGNDAKRNSVKDYLTNEQLIDVKSMEIFKNGYFYNEYRSLSAFYINPSITGTLMTLKC